ncbi:MAG TPA: AAA family ATPase [Spirochaetia bacterium]|nr:AAA family ATPase [Dehalobacter sp.]NLK71617.1 AAA family ATPase [Clostridiales bacterium]HQK35405.1 AAA family ATPase [Spirochaetales bacterium]HRS64876.1 AAA family ATPase [Spirochaetia bacterium]
MRLICFSVTNYRSITTAHKIQMSNLTVLVGKNNEGKSNILRALSLAMDIMRYYSENPRISHISIRSLRVRYNWESDFPISLQERKPNGNSSIDLTFELTNDELQTIRTTTGIRLNSNLPIRVSMGKSDAIIDIPKRGTPAFANATNKQRIIEFVCNKIDFNFIPAVRTDNDAIRVLERLIERELYSLEENPDYINATATIERLQQQILDDISARIVLPLQTFLPSVRDMQIHIQKDQRRAALRRNIEVIINDGTPTAIQSKGDGIKSLAALAMLNISNRPDRVSVIAIEEPESHLHPEAARQLYKTVSDLSKNYQVILTTHSPLFVNRMNLQENIIVDGGKATPVKKIKEIREVLGTIVSDNLINAEYILVVEGEEDKIVLEKLLPNMSEKIKRAMHAGTFIIDHVGGAGNLPYKLSLHRSIQCKYHILLDDDDAGRAAGEQAEIQGFATIRNITYTKCNGSPNAELEDCFAVTAYKQAILDEFGVTLDVSEFRSNGKWSDRVATCFRSQGKQWGDRIEKKVKFVVANAVPADANITLNPHKRTSIDALVTAIEEMI